MEFGHRLDAVNTQQATLGRSKRLHRPKITTRMRTRIHVPVQDSNTSLNRWCSQRRIHPPTHSPTFREGASPSRDQCEDWGKMEAPPPGPSPIMPILGRVGQRLHPSYTFANSLRLLRSAIRTGGSVQQYKVSRGYGACRMLMHNSNIFRILRQTKSNIFRAICATLRG